MTGRPISGHSLDEHVQSCAPCAELVEDRALLGRRLAGAAPVFRWSGDAVLTATQSSIDRERGLRAYLRSRPTRMRWALALSMPLVLLDVEVLRRRVPWKNIGSPRLLTGLLLLGVLGAVVRVAIAPLPIDRTAARLCQSLAAVAWCLPCALWLAPEGRPSPELTGSFGSGALCCFAYGSAVSAPSLALLWALDRGTRVANHVRALAAGAVALTANLMLMFHCPVTTGAHLLSGHFSIGLVWLVAASLATGWVARGE